MSKDLEPTDKARTKADSKKLGMLVLSRRRGQRIFVDVPDAGGVYQRVELVVLGMDGVQVRLGLRADRNVRILRGELLKYKDDSRTQAPS